MGKLELVIWWRVPLLLIVLLIFGAGGAVVDSFQRKGTLKTIQSGVGGDVIDCVDIYQQPAFDHPLLKNHKLQRKPKWYPERWKPKKNGNANGNDNEKKTIHQYQPWLEKGECPQGTIPIRRRRNWNSNRNRPDDENHNDNYKYIGLMKRRLYDIGHNYEDDPYSVNKAISGSPETAGVRLSLPGGENSSSSYYHGLCAEFDIWNPITRPTEYSSTRIIAYTSNTTSGVDQNETRFDAFEAGWIVYPGRYYGTQTRLYTLWTNDSFTNYCYDLDCPGFIQVENKYAIGCVLWATSKYGGEQQTLEIKIWREPQKGNWWFRVGDTVLGYWPSELFPLLSKGAQRLEWGGEVLDTKSPAGNHNKHTTTQMGSGVMPYQGFRYAAYMSGIYYVNSTHYPVEPGETMETVVTKPMCYGLGLHPKDDSPSRGVYFFYGGPGFSDECV